MHMKSTSFLLFLLTATIIAVSAFSIAKPKYADEPWTSKQLLAPVDLANTINDPAAKQPIIFCVGPGALIKNSIDVGPAKEKENLDKMLNKVGPIIVSPQVSQFVTQHLLNIALCCLLDEFSREQYHWTDEAQ